MLLATVASCDRHVRQCIHSPYRQVSTEEAQKKAEELGIAFIETSAKDATHVELAFQMMSAELIKKREKQTARPTGDVGLGRPRASSATCTSCPGN